MRRYPIRFGQTLICPVAALADHDVQINHNNSCSDLYRSRCAVRILLPGNSDELRIPDLDQTDRLCGRNYSFRVTRDLFATKRGSSFITRAAGLMRLETSLVDQSISISSAGAMAIGPWL